MLHIPSSGTEAVIWDCDLSKQPNANTDIFFGVCTSKLWSVISFWFDVINADLYESTQT